MNERVVMVASPSGHDIGIVPLEDGTYCLFDFGRNWNDKGRVLGEYDDVALAQAALDLAEAGRLS